MVLHVVLMKPRTDLTPADRRALVAAFDRAIRAIPSVRGVRLGRRLKHGAGYEAATPDSGDYLAIVEFDDVAGLQAYLAHAAHQELGARFGESLSSALVYGFEEGRLEDLAESKSRS